MRILKLPAKILYYVSDEYNKICKNVFLCVSIQIAARISTGKLDMAIAHSWICLFMKWFWPFLIAAMPVIKVVKVAPNTKGKFCRRY